MLEAAGRGPSCGRFRWYRRCRCDVLLPGQEDHPRALARRGMHGRTDRRSRRLGGLWRCRWSTDRASARRQHNHVGNLVEDPELRFTNNGIAVANLRVAVTQRIQQDGEWRDGDTSLLKVNVWRGQAEHLADSLAKGDRVMVTGRLRQRSWETPEGDKRSVTEIEADEVGASPQVGHGQGRTHQPARQRRTGSGPGAAGRARRRLQRRATDLLNAGRSPGSAAVGFQGAGRSLHKRHCRSAWAGSRTVVRSCRHPTGSGSTEDCPCPKSACPPRLPLLPSRKAPPCR